ncbi:2-dehydropantoate 2-reductase [Litoribacillus peritrichatus]|uniref:2-dehydropantoate 2-reductase n=1 Tax=Litoribacillus peritrichatus TaxID=718191 RepID=A0ABP7MIS0_9GAMM
MKNIMIFGAGAIGATVAAWLKESADNNHLNFYVFDKPEVADHINTQGIETYLGETPQQRTRTSVTAYSELDKMPVPDLIILCIKNYSLNAVSQLLQDKYGTDVIIVALQNGVENQKVLPNYFNKVIYGVVCFNAWVDNPAVVGYQKKGPIALGHKGGLSSSELKEVAELFNNGVETNTPANFDDASHAKIVINLTNSLTTLVALHQNDQSKSKEFQKLLTTMTYEGVKVMEAAGFKESKLGGMPSWTLIKAAGILPGFLTRKPYLKNLKKMVISSMAQDIIVQGGHASELETINGYVLSLADKYKVNVPVNQAIYKLCKSEFSKSPFTPLSVEKIWESVR